MAVWPSVFMEACRLTKWHLGSGRCTKRERFSRFSKAVICLGTSYAGNRVRLLSLRRAIIADFFGGGPNEKRSTEWSFLLKRLVILPVFGWSLSPGLATQLTFLIYFRKRSSPRPNTVNSFFRKSTFKVVFPPDDKSTRRFEARVVGCFCLLGRGSC